MEPFIVDWSEAKFEALRDRVRQIDPIPTPQYTRDWSHGCSPEYLSSFLAHWINDASLDDSLRELTRYPQIRTDIDGLDMHAVHVPGEAEGSNPLLLLHGWPGSVYEFWDVIEPLAFPSRFGGSKDDAFDLVIPSLPGFGFSGKPETPIGPRKIAGLMRQLMNRLGYHTFFAQGGDWGSAVATWLALDHEDAMRGIHLNYLLVQPNAQPTTNEEKEWKEKLSQAQQAWGAYSHLQQTKPASLAYAMHDNPVAQAAWILERFHDWSDQSERSFEQIFTKQRLLTNILIYLMNDAFISSTYIYLASREEGSRQMPDHQRVNTPTAITLYPDPRVPAAPKSWMEKGYNLTRSKSAPKGGHFAAMEAPDFFIEDLRAWLHETR